MTTVDTSVVVAAFARWHEHHDPAWHALSRIKGFLAPCWVETYAVLTRLPPPHRVAPDVAASFLESAVPGTLLTLPSRRYRVLPAAGVSGGAIYDALLAATAAEAGLTLVTLDERAARTYERVGARFELLIT